MLELLDPRRVVRALDDLHTLATVALRIQDDVHRLAEAADGLLALGAKADALLARVDDIDRRVADGLPVAREMIESAAILNTTASTLAAVVEPLQGITERLGRLTERLPGGRR